MCGAWIGCRHKARAAKGVSHRMCHTRCVTLGAPAGRDFFIVLQQERLADSSWRISRGSCGSRTGLLHV